MRHKALRVIVACITYAVLRVIVCAFVSQGVRGRCAGAGYARRRDDVRGTDYTGLTSPSRPCAMVCPCLSLSVSVPVSLPVSLLLSPSGVCLSLSLPSTRIFLTPPPSLSLSLSSFLSFLPPSPSHTRSRARSASPFAHIPLPTHARTQHGQSPKGT